MWKWDNKVTYSSCGCFLARIVIPEEHTEMDWNNSCLKHERPQKMRRRTHGSTLGESVKLVSPE